MENNKNEESLNELSVKSIFSLINDEAIKFRSYSMKMPNIEILQNFVPRPK
jgi:hypothetical protein